SPDFDSCASSMALIDLSRPMWSDVTIPGKTTSSRVGSNGNVAAPAGVSAPPAGWRGATPPSGGFCVTLRQRLVGLGHERGVDALLDSSAGDHALAHITARRQVEHDAHERLFDDGAQPAGAGAALQRLARDGLQRLVGEDQLDAVQREELLVLLGER